ncbi:hypothetical protein EG327_000287 [Venturia inaequalis]|uniref:WW domain-containing protein n=1 Tax=Venturia inaequalis TaxID=5025 RepID=A0A8H3VJ87_VENIN|nr:hypothetical protein EG327_000287 [Venturia inaequalis]
MWYEHRSSGFKTWITPMTAVVVLPPGWVHMRDPQGNLYYQNNITRETTRIPPANLPPGWIESKDPDGKLFFVNHELQLASWCRPGHQPPLAASTAATNSAVISNNQAARPALADIPATSNMHPQPIVMAPKPNVQGQRSVAGPRLGQQQVSLAAATEATINLLDPSNGGIVRNTKIVSHIAGQSVKGTVKAVAQNQRLQTFARGTGIAMANKKVKKAWRKAAKEVASLDGHRKQEIFVTQSGPQGKIAVQGANASFDGEYVIEYEDGTVEYYDAKQRLLRTSTIGSWPSHQQNPKLMHRHANQQRPPLQTQSHPVQGQQLLLQPAQQQTQSSQSQSQQGSMQQGQLQQSQFQQPLLQASDLPQGSPQQVRIQNYQTLQAQPQPSQPQQGPIQQFQSQPQAQQIQTYHSQLQQSVQGQLQQAVQGQLQQALQSQLQPDQPQQAQTSQTQNQFQAQQNQSLMDQLQQAAQDQVYQAVQQQLTQKQAAQAQQSQSQPQSHAQQTQSILQQQQDQNQQMQQLLQQSKLQAQQNFNQQLQQQLQRQQQQQTASEPPYAQTQPSLLDQAISVFQESTQQQPQSVFIDQAPAQTVYMDQSPAQAIYIDQNYQDRSYVVQEETILVEDGSCDQVYELQDDGCVDGSYEVDTGDCGGFDDASFDL